MQINVELRKHIGQKRTRLGIVNVEHDQFMVFASSDEQPKPMHIGYIGKKEGSPFNGVLLFREVAADPVVKRQILDQVKALLKQAVGVSWEPEVFEPEIPSEVVAQYADVGDDSQDDE